MTTVFVGLVKISVVNIGFEKENNESSYFNLMTTVFLAMVRFR